MPDIKTTGFKIPEEDRLVKIYKDTDVFTETMKRIEVIHSMFDHIYISFSGGKDSLVCLKMFELFRKANHIKEKLNVVFYDEELVDTRVIAFVKSIMDSGRYNFQWWCAPLESEKYILGKKEQYIQWDPNRKHIRPIPEWGLTAEGTRYQDKVSELYTKGVKGKIAIILGLRAQESLNRLRSVFNNTNVHPYINSEKSGKTVCKPIYDWTEKDVFKFFYDYNIKYCDAYDYQIFNKDKLRVSTPLHAEAAKTGLLKLKTNDPVLYDQIIDIFPDVELQVRYFKEYSKSVNKNSFDKYPHTWDGVIQFARESIDDIMVEKVIKKIIYCKRCREKSEREGDPTPLGGYPIKYMFEQIAKGAYKRMIPRKFGNEINNLDFEFEGKNIDDYGNTESKQ